MPQALHGPKAVQRSIPYTLMQGSDACNVPLISGTGTRAAAAAARFAGSSSRYLNGGKASCHTYALLLILMLGRAGLLLLHVLLLRLLLL